MLPRAHYPYTLKFETGLLALVLKDPTLYARYYGVWKPEYFADRGLANIFRLYEIFKSKVNGSPGQETLINLVLGRADTKQFPSTDVEQTIDLIRKVYAYEPEDADMLKASVIQWAKQKAIEIAIIRAGQASNDFKVDEARRIMDEAYRVGGDVTDIGLSLDKDTENLSNIFKANNAKAIPTGLRHFDSQTRGGVRPGELTVVMGPMKSFKSGTLLNMTIPALSAPLGLNVTYITLEISECNIMLRYGMRISRCTEDQWTSDPEGCEKIFQQGVSGSITGNLCIKEFPTGTMTASMLRSYLDRLESKDHKTDLLVVDMADLMKPEVRSDREHINIASCFRDLRGIAQQLQVPVITACQTNRSGIGKKEEQLNMSHVAGSMGIISICDYCIGLIPSEDEELMVQKMIASRNSSMSVYFDCIVDKPTMFMQHTGVIRYESKVE